MGKLTSKSSAVSFGPKQRYQGESAKTQEIGNFKNTISVLKRLAGRSFDDPDVYSQEARFVNCQLVEGEENGEVAAQVLYLNEPRSFTFTQLCAGFLTKVKEIGAAELGTPVTDCVLSVPGWFNNRQRRALKDAAEIAGLNPLRILNDTTACKSA
jgi:heat shock protein 4